MKKGFFIPVNDVPNMEELLGEAVEETTEDTEKVSESAINIPVTPGEAVPGQTATPPTTQVDFVWGFLFADIPTIYAEGNKIFFNGEVSKDSTNMIKQAMNEVGKITLMKYHELGIHNPGDMKIELYINSPGGCMSSGFDLIDYMSNFYIPVHTIGTGTIASMGVMILLSGAKRYITKNSHILVHQFRAGVQGKRQDILDYIKHFEHIQTQSVDFIVDKTNLNKMQVVNMLKNESWLTANDALSAGFVDEIK